jgi:hypothetical protein
VTVAGIRQPSRQDGVFLRGAQRQPGDDQKNIKNFKHAFLHFVRFAAKSYTAPFYAMGAFAPSIKLAVLFMVCSGA